MSDEIRVLTVLRWEEPPPAYAERTKSRYDVSGLKAKLMATPGEWAVVAEGVERDVCRVAQIVRARVWGQGGQVEVTTRLVGTVHRVYARWVPGVAR